MHKIKSLFRVISQMGYKKGNTKRLKYFINVSRINTDLKGLITAEILAKEVLLYPSYFPGYNEIYNMIL